MNSTTCSVCGVGFQASRRGGTVRVKLRVPQGSSHPLLQVFANHVLQFFGFFVDLVPGVAESLNQEGLEQSVVAEHLQRHPPSGLG